jgi:hypothetical protein
MTMTTALVNKLANALTITSSEQAKLTNALQLMDEDNGPVLMSYETTEAQVIAAQALYRALSVMLLDDRIAFFLVVNDPKAYAQAHRAVAMADAADVMSGLGS